MQRCYFMLLTEPPPLSLYVHLPWCVRKCPYCDFNSHRVSGALEADAYLRSLLADLASERAFVGRREILSVFIGGGTPSLFPAPVVASLLQWVRKNLNCSSEMEVTLEANPGAFDSDRFAGYRRAGVNRLSIGVQSFDSGCLRALGRIHDPQEAESAATAAGDCGFENINLDLMFGLPGQRLPMTLDDIHTAIGLKPGHISFYQLTLEPNTPFYNAPPELPSEDDLWDMQQAGHSALTEAGYRQYEVSAFAQPGRECRHNLNYWRFGDYLGIGAGAHSKLSDLSDNRIVRRWRVRDPQRYLAAAGTQAALAGEKQLSADDLVVEFMLNALRLNQGFDQDLFHYRTGVPWQHVSARVERAVAKGLLVQEGSTVTPTLLGRRFLDDLVAMFLVGQA